MKTYKDIRLFNVSVDTFLKRDSKNIQTKLGYALKKVSQDQIKKALNEYKDAYIALKDKILWEKQIDLALTDKETGAVLVAPKDSDRPFLYDKEGLKKISTLEKEFNLEWEKQSEEFDKKEFEIDPYYVVDLPEDLTGTEIEAFTGFVIKANEVLPE